MRPVRWSVGVAVTALAAATVAGTAHGSGPASSSGAGPDTPGGTISGLLHSGGL